MRKLKIAQVANIWQSLPPSGYGGTERVIFNISEGLVRKGHDVTVFTTADSKITAQKRFFFKEKLLHKNISWNNYLFSLTHFLWAYDEIKKSGDFDIVHGHLSLASDFLSIALAHQLQIPSVFTLHLPLDTSERKEDRKDVFQFLKNSNYVSISNQQRLPINLNYIRTIYHGIEIENYKFNPGPTNDTMAWIGRIVPAKGLEYALELSLTMQKKLLIGGRVDDENEANLNYYKTKIEHKLDSPYITHYGEVVSEKRNEIYAKSKCLLFPIQWEEPFGLVTIESMACGTPVVAFARGSVPEIVKDGVNGFIVNSSDDDIRGDFIIKKTGMEGLKEAVERIYSMPEKEYKNMRHNCRQYVESFFTVEQMVKNYEEVYLKIITK